MANLNEQFDILSNTLRLLPEEIIRLNYFIKEINEPEEGISNVEAACTNILNNVYGLMCALKDAGACVSIYEHDAIATTLCIRHVLQHQSGRLKNNLRDAWSRSMVEPPVLIKYGVNDPGCPDQPFYVSASWLQDGIKKSNNSKRLASINTYWNLDLIKQQVEASGLNWNSTYICTMTIITETIRVIVSEYGHLISAAGYDSNVYLDHFREVKPVNKDDYGILTQNAR